TSLEKRSVLAGHDDNVLRCGCHGYAVLHNPCLNPVCAREIACLLDLVSALQDLSSECFPACRFGPSVPDLPVHVVRFLHSAALDFELEGAPDWDQIAVRAERAVTPATLLS